MKLENIILDNFTTICLIVGLGVLIFTNRSFDKRSNHLFMHFIGLVLLLDVADIADFYMSSFCTTNNFRYITSALGYTLRPSAIAILISILQRRKKFNICLWIPLFILAIIAFTSYYTHFMFWFDVHNTFCRGPVGYASHIYGLIYSVILLIITIKKHHMLDIGEILVIAYIIFICAFAVIAESTLYIKFLLPCAMSVSCTLYYIFLFVETYKRDELTGLLNRKSLYADAKKMSNRNFAVISMDLNGLKNINDTKGHQAGDIAIRTFADTCLAVANKKYRVYRIGGDEFLALGYDITSEEAQNFIDNMRNMLKETEYMASFGYALYSYMDSFDDICNKADKKMYEDKAHYKHRECVRE